MIIKRIKNYISLILATCCIFSSVFSFADEPKYGDELKNNPEQTVKLSFTDVPEAHWAYKYISEMVNKKVLSGYPDEKFRPEKIITRAEFAKIIVNAAGLNAQKVSTSSFTDINPNDWYSPFIETAKDYLTGYLFQNGQYVFNPDKPALREDMAIAIVKLKGYDTKLADRSIIEAMFKDYNSISEVAKNYVSIAVENKLISGYPDETFRPQNSVTRAEAAALLWRAFMSGSQNKTENKVLISDTSKTSSQLTTKDETSIIPKKDADIPKVKNSEELDESITNITYGFYISSKIEDINPGDSGKITVKIYDTLEGKQVDYYISFLSEGNPTFTEEQKKSIVEYLDYQFSNTEVGISLLKDNFIENMWVNKELAHGESVTDETENKSPSVSPTSTPSSSSSFIPASISPTPTPTVIPLTSKYTIETICGSGGTGYIDGIAKNAFISNVSSMILDKNNNIYFLDNVKQKQYIRKYNSTTQTVETIKAIDSDFNFGEAKIVNGDFVYEYDYQDYKAVKLSYDAYEDKVYLIGYYGQKSNYYDAGKPIYTIMHQITPSVQAAIYFSSYYQYTTIGRQDFVIFNSPNTALFCKNSIASRNSSNVVEIFKASSGNEPTLFTTLNVSREYSPSGKLDIMLGEDGIYVFANNYSSKLYKISSLTGKTETVTEIKAYFDSITTYNNKFYLSSGSSIFELGTDGRINKFINGTELTLKDSFPVYKMSLIKFDSNNNIVFYDDSNNVFRILKINKEQ